MMRWQFTHSQMHWALFIFCATATLFLGVGEAFATNVTCTSDPDFQVNSAAGAGVVSAVMDTIITLLSNTSELLYEKVITDPGFVAARNAVLLLAIAIYGVMIIFNIANFKPGEIVGLLFKVGLIVSLTSATGWTFFSDFIGDFFFGTMIELIEIFMGQAAGGGTSGYIGQADIADRIGAPLAIFNWPLARIVSTQFFITVVGVMALTDYGIILGLLLLWGGFNLFMALLSALFTYIKSVVGLWFLFALAPLFFLLLLFRRTQNLFEGWINMVLSFTLQPILLFAYLAFFITITTASLGDLMNITWCWADATGQTTGSSSNFMWWRPFVINGVQITGTWTPFGNIDQFGTATGLNTPVDSVDVMFFLLSSYVAWQFAKFVPGLATELSSAGLRLSVNAEAARNFFSSRGWAPEQIGTKAVGGFMNWLK